MNLPPLSLYIHLPWCVKKCPYCDFNSHTAGDATPTARYVAALVADLQQESERAAGRRIETIFIGGGTPSLFSPDEIAAILAAAQQHLNIAESAEVTMEANPGTVESGAPEGYKEAGVNRLSIGAQSFDDQMLKRLGRIHSSDDIRRSVDAARLAGFDNINLDVMHALPGQDAAMAAADLRHAVDLEPAHISWYQLTLEPNTVFHARPPANLPDDEAAWAIQSAGKTLLAEQGYVQYEVSAYARDDRRCRHNLNYWSFGDYLAVGAGAHGKISVDDRIGRYRKAANPQQYMLSMETGPERVAIDWLDENERLFDYMLNALRLSDGFSEREFARRTAIEAERLPDLLEKPLRRGLLERRCGGFWCPTELGARFLDDLLQEFLYAQGS